MNIFNNKIVIQTLIIMLLISTRIFSEKYIGGTGPQYQIW
jgi:hypothetical protein